MSEHENQHGKKTNSGKSYVAKAGELKHKWVLVDATNKVVGRLATDIATILMGKHRPTYTPHVDTGDYIIVINAEKLTFTGKKWQQRQYEWYTGFTRLRSESAEKRRERRPELIIKEAVRLYVAEEQAHIQDAQQAENLQGAEHPYTAQTPETVELVKKK